MRTHGDKWTMRGDKTLWVMLLVVLALSLSSSPTAARSPQKYLTLTFSAYSGLVGDVHLQVIEDTILQTQAFVIDEPPMDKGFTWRLLDSAGSLLHEDRAYPSMINNARFSTSIGQLEILQNGKVVYRLRLTFCERNGMCEPCGNRRQEGSCRTIENSLTCGDCPTGGADGYCDLYQDGRCDPDCDSQDLDCPGCAPGRCFYRQSDPVSTSCRKDFGGEICDPLVPCSGRFTYADDSGSRCCVGGTCQAAQENTTPTMNTSAVTSQTTCSGLHGRICSYLEHCTGRIAFPPSGERDCCILGACVPKNQTAAVPAASEALAQPPSETERLLTGIALVLPIAGLLLIGILTTVRRRSA